MGEPFENAEAWKSARALTNEAHALCRRGALAKDFGLRDQLQRAAVIGHDQRRRGWELLHTAEKRQAYNCARRSCGEFRSMTYVLFDNGFITPAEHAVLFNCWTHSGRLIGGLIRSLGDHPTLNPSLLTLK